jgi:hypothetical protein
VGTGDSAIGEGVTRGGGDKGTVGEGSEVGEGVMVGITAAGVDGGDGGVV